MYHFFNQALHVGTDIGAGFFLSQTGYCFRVKCLFSHIQDYSWLKFGVGKQAAGESYGNVKMPGMASEGVSFFYSFFDSLDITL